MALASKVIQSVVLAILLGAAAGVGCSGKGIDETDPAILYKDAEADIKNDRYQLAIEKLRVVKNKFPYSKFSTDAQLRLADVYFLQESYGEAAMAYQAFSDLHPKHERVGYAMFRVGMSHFNDTPDKIARDLTPATKALEAFETFIKRFPNAPESKDAREHIIDSRRTLADKELYIANFYYKREIWESAKGRFDKIIAAYPETEAAKEAQAKMARTEEGVKQVKAEREKEAAEEKAKGKK